MDITAVLAGLPVANVDTAIPWYEQLFGRPPDARPMPPLADWNFEHTGTLQLVEDADRAGGGLVTFTVADLRSHMAAVAARGIDVAEIDDTTSDKVLFTSLRDPEGNSITLVEQRT